MPVEQTITVKSLADLPIEIIQKIFLFSDRPDWTTLELVHSIFSECYLAALLPLLKRVHTTYKEYIPAAIPYEIPTYSGLAKTFSDRLLSPRELYLTHLSLTDEAIALLAERLSSDQFKTFLCAGSLTSEDMLPHAGLLSTAVVANNITLLKWSVNSQGLVPLTLTVSQKREGIRAYRNEIQDEVPSTLNVAAGWGRLRIVQYLIEEKAIRPTSSTLNAAARSGCINIMKYLIEQQKVLPILREDKGSLKGVEKDTTLEAAIDSGKISCVKYAVGLSNIMSDPSGSLAFIKQLIQTGAIEHLKIAFYLLDVVYCDIISQLREPVAPLSLKGGTRFLFDLFVKKAVANGDLEALQYLVETKGISLGSDLLYSMLVAGSRALAEYLIDIKKLHIPLNILETVIEAGNCELAQYFIEEKHQIPTKDMLKIAAYKGHLPLLQYLLLVFSDTDLEILEALFSEAARAFQVHIVMYLLEDRKLTIEDLMLSCYLLLLLEHAKSDTLLWVLKKLIQLEIPIHQESLLKALFSNYSPKIRETLHAVEKAGIEPIQERTLKEIFKIDSSWHKERKPVISQNKNTLAWLHEWYKNSHEQSVGHTLKPLHLQPDLRRQLIEDYLDPTEEAMKQLAIAGLLEDCRVLLAKVEAPEEKSIFVKIVRDNFLYPLGDSAEAWLQAYSLKLSNDTFSGFTYSPNA